ncbi:MAG: hypothetical protein D6683_03930 [Actinomyces sp.]|nr:MAG: hypothetical protein D6683_03930 [Actinomyces sp.]
MTAPADVMRAGAAKLGVPFETVPGFATRNSNPAGAFHPVAFMLHHTASPRGSDARGYVTRTAASQLFVDRAGKLWLVASGRTRHPGRGSSRVLADIAAGRPVVEDAADRGLVDDTDGYAFFVGVEVDNDGVGEPYSAEVVSATVAAAAITCAWHGWSPDRVIHHRQWTRRKVDMSLRDDLRPAIAAAIAELTDHQEAPMSTLADPQPAWAQDAVTWALGHGITTGSRDADAPVTARELVTMMYRAHKVTLADAQDAVRSAVDALPPTLARTDVERIATEVATSTVLRARLALP